VTLAIALALAAVVVNLTPDAQGAPHPAPERALVRTAGDSTSLARSPIASHHPELTRAMPRSPGGQPAPSPFPRVSADGPWVSPLYPQNDVTLWDRIRVSSSSDQRAFLLGTAIQVHAPQTAATPASRFVPPSKAG
jgi:hypothetical protein